MKTVRPDLEERINEDMEKMEIVTSFSEGKANAQMDNSLLMPDGTAFKNEEEKEKEKENKGTVTE